MYPCVKRGIDLVFSILALIALSPVFAVLAIFVKTSSPGPVIFRQKRVGRNRRAFTIYKFRTMYEGAPHMTPAHKLKGAARFITPAGTSLRESSLDELPQLLNILKGEMSLVGPRPALPNQTDLLNERDRYGANAVRPGLTGWAQINGRNEIPVPLKARYDGEYVRNMSFLFDAKCVVGTLLGMGRPGRLRVGADKNA